MSDVPGLTFSDVEDQGLSAGDLLDDGSSATTLVNAVLSLPRLAAERGGLQPVVLTPNDEPLPEGATPTGTPGSDWLRENLVLLALSVGAVLAGLVALVAAFPRGRGGRPGPPQAAGPRTSTTRGTTRGTAATDPWSNR